ncbi:MAG: hypothetical protein WCY88_07010 [Spongiibacteraceae bacterium]
MIETTKHQTLFLKTLSLGVVAVVSLLMALAVEASSTYHKVDREYVVAANAPASQSQIEVDRKNTGCISCHTDSDSKTMHVNPGVKLSCTDCHGGNTTVMRPIGSDKGQEVYLAAMSEAHVLPQIPDKWPTPSSRNPERTYALLNHESPEFIRFINPSDYRIVKEACGACHATTIEASMRSLHATGAMLWGGASYNNGILPFKNYILGEGYDRNGDAIKVMGPVIPNELKQVAKDKGVLEALAPLPAWETVKPGDIFRVFERGGRNITNLFPETGLPSNLGQIQRLEEPGRPDFRQSNRGEGTGGRISVPVINITKTRLNDPLTWFIGTNDQPGDYRNSGCASCHVVYANDRDPRHSGPYAQFGHDGKTITNDPTISPEEKGHPLQHTFTRAIPTSQCMICHMHQPNMFMNSFLGYTMWDYESDAPHMWPEQQQYPSHEETLNVLNRNPEGASPRGKWADLDFLKGVWDNNDKMNDTQFADYHGHGWNFRAVFKRDRKGNLLDAEGEKVADDDPEKFDKAVHMSSVHVDVGMHCVDCHFSQDNHGNGHIYGEVALAVEVDCKDCHGTAKEYPNLFTSGPAALEGGADLSLLRTPDGRRRFEWVGGELFQRSSLYPDKEWKLSLVKDSVTKGNPHYNEKAARAKLMSKDTEKQNWGEDVPADQLAHSYDDMECYTCHTSWTTSCGGCHLPIEANWKTERHHYEGGESRNYATYNPQVARDQVFMLGRRGPAKGGKIAPTRSSSALVLSSTNSNREKIYIQQPPIAASGYSSQAFNPHFPHTVRKTETKTCSDCHVSKDNDNNAIMAQLLMQGTNFINFVGYNAWLGGAGEVSAVQVTEWDEPQAVMGSYLHRYAYPDWYQKHLDNDMFLQNAHQHSAGAANCLQLRGEYLYVAEGDKGVQVYDVAGIANKGISQRIITAPFSPLGHDAHVDTTNATCIALPSNQPINPLSNQGDLMRVENLEQPFHPIYNYAVVTDAKEGLILININTFADGEPRNNFIDRAVTWNVNDVLRGAKHVTIGGHYLYIAADQGVVIVDVDKPLEPRLVKVIPLQGVQATALQFRYLFVTDEEGLKVVDISNVNKPKLVADNTIAMNNAYKMHLARTYAYVAAGDEGVVIVDISQPEAMTVYQRFNADGQLKDSRDVIVATTNASLMAYVADGEGGLKVLQITSPESQPKFYGFSPEPKPQLIARYQTSKPALSLSRPLERDRGVDETGGQIAVFGRRGSRPLNKQEMEQLYLNKDGELWFVEDK